MGMDRRWLCVCFLAFISLSVEGAELWEELRLPANIKPNNYDLTLHPNLTTDTFTGVVDIDVNVTGSTSAFLVHIKALNITNAKVTKKGTTEEPSIEKVFEYAENEFYVIKTTNDVPAGDYILHYEFSGSLVGSIVGFYKSTYYNKDGKLMNMATSKFEPTDARRAFPCFDEPNLKATYITTLVHTDEYFALSNMDVNTTDIKDGLQYTKFNPSVKMSTYLACFIVCDFGHIEGVTARGVPFRVYAPHDSMDQADYALRIGIDVTNYYEDYFDIPYPLPKLDMIAIPDFVSGAMEHWGLITYRETNLLYDEQESSESNKQRVAAVIAHELAHQWFGNIVTMDWWDDLWLNEGFASFLEYSGVNHAEPDWQMLDQFVTEDMYYVMGLDQIITSHPIILEVNHPDEINEIFDSISYSKGASVLRMLNNIMGEEDFRTGLTNYLNKYSYGNAKTQDLWAELDDVSPAVDIKGLMDTWTLQMGFPVVKLERADSITLYAQQEWFLVDPAANKSRDEFGSPYDYKWNIYLDYYFHNGSDGVMLMDKGDVPVTNSNEFEWVIANLNQTGYYRVNYDVTIWNALIEQLLSDHTMISAADRSGLIDDAFNLAKAGQIDYMIPLNMTKYLFEETEYIPWDTAYSNLNWISGILRYRPVFADWRKYIQRQVKPLLDSLTWDDTGTTHLESYLRSDIISLSCSHGDPDCLSEAENLFKGYTQGAKTSPNLRSQIYRYGMENTGDQGEWDMMWDQYLNANVSQERTRLLYGMARTRTVWLLCRYLTYATMDESKVRSQDFFSVVNYIADNPVGNPLVWDWVRANWEALVTRFGISSRSLGRLVPSICEFYATEFKLQQMKDFFNAYPDAGAGERGRKQALERVQTNIEWLKVNEKKIEMWLADNMQ